MAHPAKAYQRVRVTTASPEELVVLLCEGLLRHTAAAADAIDDGLKAVSGGHFERAAAILGHLRESLDEAAAPELARSLDQTYALWTLCLLRAQVEQDAARMRALVPQMQGLLEAWRLVLHGLEVAR